MCEKEGRGCEMRRFGFARDWCLHFEGQRGLEEDGKRLIFHSKKGGKREVETAQLYH